ncbi:hypothetical protein GCM10027418_30990 [Mariniluteicoccus endophyticus]
MELEGRLKVGAHVIAEFDYEVPGDLLAVFTRAMTASPTECGMPSFEATGSALGDRLDVMGWDAASALSELDSSLALARSAYESLHMDADPTAILSDPWSGLSGLDAAGWLRRVRASTGPESVWTDWALSLLHDRDPNTVLRLMAIARPDEICRLEVQPDVEFDTEVPRRLLVMTQTAEDAAAISGAVQGRAPHLTDLVRVAHLGGDGEPGTLRGHVLGLAELTLKQPLVAVFRPGTDPAMATIVDVPRLQVLVASTDPVVDPSSTLAELLTLRGVGGLPPESLSARLADDVRVEQAHGRPASD